MFTQKCTSCKNNISYIDRSLQTMDVNFCTYPQEGVKISTSYCDHSGKKINYKPTSQEGGINLCTNLDQSHSSIRYYVCSPREGAVNLCTDLNQLETRKLLKVHPPREAADNLCTISDQSEIKRRIHYSAKILNHSITSCNKTQFPPVSN